MSKLFAKILVTCLAICLVGGLVAGCQTVPQQGHVHTLVHNEAKAPTCVNNGILEHWYCPGCNARFSDEAATTEVTFADLEVEETGHVAGADDGDCTTAVDCTVCGKVATPAAKAHTPEKDDGDCTTNVMCTQCAKIAIPGKAAHEANEDDGDCTTAVTCKHCDVVTTEAAQTHTPGAAATCTAAQTCTVCSTELAPATGHTWTDVEGKAASCTDDGYTSYKKCDCGAIEGKEVRPATGHSFVNSDCINCDEKLKLNLQYRWGTEKLIQINTNLPVTTPIKDFLADQNGCSIDQSVNKYQWFGWASMANADGVIVITLNFNNAFAVGQTYILPAGAVFGFTDGSTYVLDANYVFIWDGSNWTVSDKEPEPEPEPEPEVGELSFQHRYGTSKLIQFNTNLPATTPLVNFTAGDNGCSIDQSGNKYQQVGWIQMDNANGTIVLTFHFNNAFEAGQTYVLPAGAVFGFTDGSKYTLDKDYTCLFNGNDWSIVEPGQEPEVNSMAVQYRWGNGNTLQVNTDLPAATPIANFLATDNGCSINQSGNQQVGWIAMANADGIIVLTFNFNSAFEVGQTYVLSAGSVFGFTDGNTYTLDANYTFTWDGSNWAMTTN